MLQSAQVDRHLEQFPTDKRVSCCRSFTIHCLSICCGCAQFVAACARWLGHNLQQDAERERIITQGIEVEIQEECAMTTRVSPSFIRVGHFDLFGRCQRTAAASRAYVTRHVSPHRRARKAQGTAVASTLEQLRLMYAARNMMTTMMFLHSSHHAIIDQ